MKIDRLLSIVMTLLEQERIGAQALAEMFEVSPRTIYRDIDAINLAGIPVYSVPGVGGGFEIMPQYKVAHGVFSSADLSAMLMGLSNLSAVIHGEELVNALAKVKSFVPAERARDIELKASQICIDMSPWLGNRSIQPNLETIQTALQERRLLSFDYADRYGSKTTRTAEPCQLVLKSSQWYWQGYCHKRNDFRLFKLARMTNLHMQEEVFTPREYPKPQLDIAEMVASLQTTIQLRIHHSLLDRVLDFCAYEHFAPDGEEHYVVQFPFIENDFHYNILFSFGNRCECLGQPHIRAEMARRTQRLAALYER